MGFSPFTLNVITKHDFYISFMGHILWNSNEDERDFYEDEYRYEPLREYLINESQLIMFVLTGGFTSLIGGINDNK